ncbi:acyl-peptide hydrolase [Mangrovactinospora gilvigrisea]|uniref:Acyl-peptide hydrolase n=1 Tax=Mangrovactinospora gilvigrisea TaxID=1428644 RepID=A0A1J7B9S4_9ACTN|nr:prolyl oligopeptidase family serine peptidase [Mangrovactinospora gilvigrisea]OIV35349.1 acyl-peptide hydrolase [Mangrovactinospora gilvigrisea]
MAEAGHEGRKAVTAGYGAWASPVSAAGAAAHDGRPTWVRHVGDEVWWTEPRPSEAGRVALVRRRADGRVQQLLEAPWNVRSRVHEYGGRSWTAAADRGGKAHAVFANFADQRLYRIDPDGEPRQEPRPLTPEPAIPSGLRYLEPQLVPERGEVWCIREEFHGEGPSELRRALVAVPLDGSAADDPSRVRVVLSDRHFLACPRLSPDGRRLTWIGWEHPAMPWDGTELRVALIGADGTAGEPRTVAGGPEVSVVQVEWDGPDRLLFVADPDGWWNLHRVELTAGGAADGDPVNLLPRPEEFGGPLWQLGARWFAPLPSGLIAVVHGRGPQRLAVFDPVSGDLRPCPGSYTEWAADLDVRGTAVIGVAGSAERGMEVVELDTSTGYLRVLVPAGLRGAADVPAAYLPHGESRAFQGPDGREVYANVYLPRNPDFTAPEGERPPFAVWVHGGPTSRSPLVHDLEVAYFTSRGIGVAEVNYGGSTGFGREYRNRLRGQWGVVDVADAALVAEALAAEGTADGERLAIRGGSAGGFTAAAALTTDLPEAAGVFRCAAISFPVLDLVGFGSGETHDFESRYMDSLVGRLPQDQQRYEERSPSRHADRMSAPFVLLQGLEDRVCPPSQAEKLLKAVEGRGIPHRYLAFEGEQHGFRRKETMITAFEAELSLYGQVFGFTPVGVELLELRK